MVFETVAGSLKCVQIHCSDGWWFSAGKCTVTAANSLPQAGEVAEVISKLIIDLFVQCRKRGVNTAPSKRARKR